MKVLNENDAPPGFVAVRSGRTSCGRCALRDDSGCMMGSDVRYHCEQVRRRDGCEVYFVRRTGPVMATANFPHDDMGAPA